MRAFFGLLVVAMLFVLAPTKAAFTAAMPENLWGASTPQQPCAPPPSSTRLVDPPGLYAQNGVLDLTLTLEQSVNETFRRCAGSTSSR
jgi:hypothetical protein